MAGKQKPKNPIPAKEKPKNRIPARNMLSPRITGPGGQLYADPQPSPDATSFQVDNTSAAYYQSPYYLAHMKQAQPIPPRNHDSPLSLADFLPPTIITAIQNSGTISFHAVGDTGAAKVSRSQTAATALEHEETVADAMANELRTGGDRGPAFFFHLGDVIYNFGEAQYYFDQFYEPYREYDRPIFAIPGNHDGAVFGSSTSAPKVPTLQAFLTNFCATTPGPSPDSGGLIRSAMIQPGVYFTLDAPFVSIIGLYSNVLEFGGIISSQSGKFPVVGDDQLAFLKSELTRLKPDRAAHKRAVLLAVHHPTVSADSRHGGSTGIEADIAACCTQAGLWPDMILSGHAHLYQRFTWNTAGKKIPILISGSGGFATTRPIGNIPAPGTTIGDHTLEIAPIVEFGYVTITTDGKTSLSATFKTADKQNNGKPITDSVKVNL